MSLAFFINARAKPVEAGPDRFGSGTSIVLHNAPSLEEAEAWAADYARQVLLGNFRDQRITEVKAVPIDGRLLTSTGEEPIDWNDLIRAAEAWWSNPLHRRERHASMKLMAPNEEPSEPSSPDIFEDIDRLKRAVPNPEIWNWDSSKQFYYVTHHANRAFLVRAFSMLVASGPYFRRVRGTPDGDYCAYVTPWPGAKEYVGPVDADSKDTVKGE